jgi:hypothetical protein
VLRLQRALQFLSPIDVQIRRFQTKQAYLSDLYDSWKLLQSDLTNMISRSDAAEVVPSPDLLYLGEKLQSQVTLLLSPPHEIAYSLDPRYYGQHPVIESDESMASHVRFLIDSGQITFPSTLPNKEAAVSKELSEFHIDCATLKENRNLRLKFLVDGEVSLSEYWNSISLRFPLLSQIAVKIFTLSPSSYASEHYWNHKANIESRFSEELSSDHRKKMLKVKCNLPGTITMMRRNYMRGMHWRMKIILLL